MRNCLPVPTVILLFFCFTTCLLYAQDGYQTEFIQEVQNTKIEITSIKSDFEQTLSMSVLASEQYSKGKFFYRSPGKLKWQELEPNAYTLVINGDDSYKIENGQRKQLAAGGMQVVGFKRFILGTLDGSIFKSDHFKSSFEKKDGLWKIQMIPLKKALSKRFDQIDLTFDQENLLLKELIFLEPGGDTRRISFSNHQINTLSDDSEFK